MSELARARRIAVDREACMGSGLCIVYAPATFMHDEEIKAVVKEGPGDSPAALEAAIEACPMGALSLVAADGDS